MNWYPSPFLDAFKKHGKGVEIRLVRWSDTLFNFSRISKHTGEVLKSNCRDNQCPPNFFQDLYIQHVEVKMFTSNLWRWKMFTSNMWRWKIFTCNMWRFKIITSNMWRLKISTNLKRQPKPCSNCWVLSIYSVVSHIHSTEVSLPCFSSGKSLVSKPWLIIDRIAVYLIFHSPDCVNRSAVDLNFRSPDCVNRFAVSLIFQSPDCVNRCAIYLIFSKPWLHRWVCSIAYDILVVSPAQHIEDSRDRIKEHREDNWFF